MNYNIKITEPHESTSDCLLVGVFADGILSAAAEKLDKHSGGHLTKLLQRGDLATDCGQILLVHGFPQIAAQRVLVVNCGRQSDFNETAFRKITCKALQALKQTGARTANSYLIELPVKNRDGYWKIRQAAALVADVFYQFELFKSQKKPPLVLQELNFNITTENEKPLAEQGLKEAQAINAGITLSKNLSNMPANICTPTYLAQHAEQLAKIYPINVTIQDEQAIAKLGMDAFLAVARGSREPARLITLEYQGAAQEQKPIVLIGKGITFDSGGLSLKTPAHMEEMKFDMCGAASVLGVFKTVAELQLPLNLVGIIPATENMPGGNATRPGDIVTGMSGQTIEILNTDAEGRLILSDALTYSERFNPDVVIDIATLTGAVVIALGAHAAGLMGNDEPLLNALKSAGDKSWDRAWILPLWEDYQEQINSNTADMANVGVNGGKPITAACFLARFAKNLRWAHLDIAGVAWRMGQDKAATGRPVALLIQYLLEKAGF